MMTTEHETGFMTTLSKVAAAIGGQLHGADTSFTGVSTDSRNIQPGELFVALRGEKFDGHAYVAACLQQGAAAAMVDQSATELSATPLLVVEDTRQGLGQLAAYWRGQFDIPLAAITGSNGKTTVKEMLASILRSASSPSSVLATAGNLNNDIGLPLTLLKLRAHHQYAVIEMGMNHPGEIDTLTRIAHPDVALINNAQPAHLAGLGTVEAVARAKGEIFAGLAKNGVAVINQDDPHAPLWKELAAPHRIVTFGLEHTADVSASADLHTDGSTLHLQTPAGSAQIQLQVAGVHNVKNALAATAAALAMGISLTNIVTGLEQFGGVKGRLQRKRGLAGALVIDDTYNANPASMRAAIDVLANMPGQKLLVIGDMGELGSEASAHHVLIGKKAKRAGINKLFALGELSRDAVLAFGADGGAQHFDSPQALAAVLETYMVPGTTVLVKGSRFMQMERVVDLITSEPSERGAH
jgi:UDP-N-acetylmuramoyl-tripeptide--D-alanyl-D-alanine ligase